jgi:hypothetical protein
MTHETAPYRVLQTGLPGQIGGDVLAQQMRRDPKAEIATAQSLRRRGLEGLPESELSRFVFDANTRHEAGHVVSVAYLRVGVKRINGDR